MIGPYGIAASFHVYERDANGPGQAYVAGDTAWDYATRELIARVGDDPNVAGRRRLVPIQSARNQSAA
jgi:hypothetical protein